jgi:pyrroline-5-carboxylate reductase
MNITFIGGGNMANALIGGLLDRGFAKADIRVVEPNAETAARLRAQYGIGVHAEATAEALTCDLIMLAVKPQVMRAVAAGIAPHLTAQLVVSIAAGIRAADLSRWLGGHGRLVRAMPNTPAMVLSGVTGLYALPGVSPDERARAQRVLEAVGGGGGRHGHHHRRFRQRPGLCVLFHGRPGGSGHRPGSVRRPSAAAQPGHLRRRGEAGGAVR